MRPAWLQVLCGAASERPFYWLLGHSLAFGTVLAAGVRICLRCGDRLGTAGARASRGFGSAVACSTGFREDSQKARGCSTGQSEPAPALPEIEPFPSRSRPAACPTPPAHYDWLPPPEGGGRTHTLRASPEECPFHAPFHFAVFHPPISSTGNLCVVSVACDKCVAPRVVCAPATLLVPSGGPCHRPSSKPGQSPLQLPSTYQALQGRKAKAPR
jgi:hypothetical protein